MAIDTGLCHNDTELGPKTAGSQNPLILHEPSIRGLDARKERDAARSRGSVKLSRFDTYSKLKIAKNSYTTRSGYLGIGLESET
jgi:hypothetical protein